jgi:signal transduction histidine kinase
MQMKPLDLHSVINETLALVAHDMRARQIAATVDLFSNPCVISGDQVLLEQVLVNLVVNDMDAMAETPPNRRELTIKSEVSGDRRPQQSRRWRDIHDHTAPHRNGQHPLGATGRSVTSPRRRRDAKLS